MAWRKPGPVAPRTALCDALHATPALPSITPEASAFVRDSISICPIKHQLTLTLYDRLRCAFTANICTCENGQAPTGDSGDCPVNGVAKCKLCNPGWTLTNDKTKCISTFAYLHFVNQY